MVVIEAIMEKIREKVDANCPTDNFDHKGVERNKEVSDSFIPLHPLMRLSHPRIYI